MNFDIAMTDELLATTRAVRKRLDLDRPVPREVILECLGLAQQAPTGSNSQTWRWIVIDDEARFSASRADIDRAVGVVDERDVAVASVHRFLGHQNQCGNMFIANTIGCTTGVHDVANDIDLG